MRTRARRGVTLIELVVVIALMSIIAGVTVPALSSLDRREPTAVDIVSTLLRETRATAIEQGRSVVLTIDPATARYWLDVPDTTGVLALPGGATLMAPTPRVHVRFAATGEVDAEPFFVREHDLATPVVFDRWSGEARGGR